MAIPRPERRERPRSAWVIWLDGHWRFALAALFLTALAWRLAYIQRLTASPLGGTLRADERSYWDWATFLLSNRWHGVNPFFQGPLYPYFLAVTRFLSGSSVVAVLRVQAVFGSISVILLADSARRLMRPAVALVIGLALAFYQLSVMLDGLILAESLAFLIESVLIWMWCRALQNGGSTDAFGLMGVLTGLLANARGTAVLLIVPTLWLAARTAGRDRASIRPRMANAIAGMLLLIAPAAIWNWHACREFIPLTYNFGLNLYIGNNPDADGGYVSGSNRISPAPEARPDGGAEGDGREYLRKTRGLDLSPAQSSAYWAGQAAQFMREQPGRTLELTGLKLLMMWNHDETPQLERAELFDREAGPLGLPFFGTFAFLGVLGFAGLFLTGAAPLAGIALGLDVIVTMLGMLPFFVVDRYRYHLVPPLAVLAALAVESVLRRRISPDPRAMRRPALALAAGIVLVALPLPNQGRMRSEWGMALDLGTRWLDQGRPDLARAQFERAIAIENRTTIGTDADPETRRSRARLHFNYASALHSLGERGGELRWMEMAAREDPGEPRFVRALADAYDLAGRRAQADSLRRTLPALVGGDPEALVGQGWEAARAGRRADAESLFRASVELDQRRYGAWGALVRIQIERGEWAAAESSLARAEVAGMERPALLAHQALLYAASGDTTRARRALDALPAEAIANDHLLSGITAAARRMLAEHTAGAPRMP